MSRYLSDYNCRHEQYIIEFPDEYSEWCDYFIKNSVDTYGYLDELTKDQVDEILSRRQVFYTVQQTTFPKCAFEIHLSDHARHRARTMLDSLAGATNYIFRDAVEDGVNPKEMYAIKQLSDKADGTFGGYNNVLYAFDIADIRILASNPDRFIALFSDWGDAGQWLRNNPDEAMELFELPDKYDKMLQDAAADDDLCLEDIMNWMDNMDEAYNSWVDGVPVHDVFV